MGIKMNLRLTTTSIFINSDSTESKQILNETMRTGVAWPVPIPPHQDHSSVI